MSSLSLMLLLSTALAAPGSIHRCVDSDGSVSFQDRACTPGQQAAQLVGEDGTAAPDQEALRAWLETLRGPTAGQQLKRPESIQSAPRVRQTAPDSGNTRRYAAVSEYALAICSEQFLHCADADMRRMDACVSALPRCMQGVRQDCCPEACIQRYQQERREGQPLPAAVRLALLDPQAPRCASPPTG